MAGHLRTEFVVDAPNMAVAQRHPGKGVIHHSGRGSQYTSLKFGQRCRDAERRLSTKAGQLHLPCV